MMKALGANVKHDFRPGQHNLPTNNPALHPADSFEAPFVANYDYDGAGNALSYIYGPMKAKASNW